MFKNAQLFEAKKLDPASLQGSVWRVKVIEGDRKGSSAFYPKEVVEAGASLFTKGTRVYRNHPTADEKWSRPERDISDLIGVLDEDAVYESGDLYAPVRFFSEHREFIKERAEAGVIGMSIRASGDVEETADGPVLKAFTSVSSVDVVTTAGAGGGFDKLLESARQEISAAESAVEPPKEEEPEMDPKLSAALDALVESAQKNTDAIAPLAEAIGKLVERAEAEDKALEESQKPTKPSLAEIDAALTEAELPKASRAAVFAAVEAGADLAESVTAEKAKVDSILEESGRAFAGHANDEKGPKSLEEATTSVLGSVYGN